MTADGAQTAATPKPFSPYGVELSSRLLLGTMNASRNEPRPMPSAAEPRTVTPGITTGAATPPGQNRQAAGGHAPAAQPTTTASAQPGFSF